MTEKSESTVTQPTPFSKMKKLTILKKRRCFTQTLNRTINQIVFFKMCIRKTYSE